MQRRAPTTNLFLRKVFSSCYINRNQPQPSGLTRYPAVSSSNIGFEMSGQGDRVLSVDHDDPLPTVNVANLRYSFANAKFCLSVGSMFEESPDNSGLEGFAASPLAQKARFRSVAVEVEPLPRVNQRCHPAQIGVSVVPFWNRQTAWTFVHSTYKRMTDLNLYGLNVVGDIGQPVKAEYFICSQDRNLPNFSDPYIPRFGVLIFISSEQNRRDDPPIVRIAPRFDGYYASREPARDDQFSIRLSAHVELVSEDGLASRVIGKGIEDYSLCDSIVIGSNPGFEFKGFPVHRVETYSEMPR